MITPLHSSCSQRRYLNKPNSRKIQASYSVLKIHFLTYTNLSQYLKRGIASLHADVYANSYFNEEVTCILF